MIYHSRKMQKQGKYSMTISLPPEYWRKYLDPETEHVEHPFRILHNEKFLVLFPDSESPEDAEVVQKFLEATRED